MKYAIVPVPKPRQTRIDKWLSPPRPCVKRYRDFADKVRELKIEVINGDSITFGIPIPSSWTKKKKIESNCKGHIQTPDIDNLLKALLDAVHKDDSHIHTLGKLKKVWAYEGFIEVENG